MTHPTKIEGWEGSLEDLAYAVEGLRYDKTAEFLDSLTQALKERSEKDVKAGRQQLGHRLLIAVVRARDLTEVMRQVWRLCAPYETRRK